MAFSEPIHLSIVSDLQAEFLAAAQPHLERLTPSPKNECLGPRPGARPNATRTCRKQLRWEFSTDMMVFVFYSTVDQKLHDQTVGRFSAVGSLIFDGWGLRWGREQARLSCGCQHLVHGQVGL